MLHKIAQAILPSRRDRLLARWSKTLREIGALEESLARESDEGLRDRASRLKERIRERFEKDLGGEIARLSEEKESAHPNLVEAFALGREASRRILGMRHFDVQIIGGLALGEGKLAEMRTGEGKTLALTLPAIYSALNGIPTHIVTVNEYLAKRDAEQMAPLYAFFGLSTGLLLDEQSQSERKEAYGRDIVYGVNHEFGFDYLRDNMAKSPEARRMRGMGMAIVDEIDSILIDEARTPLIITGQDDADTKLYQAIWREVSKLESPEDVELEMKSRQAILTERGFERLERLLEEAGVVEKGAHLYLPAAAHAMRAAQACLSAKFLFRKDREYIVEDGKIVVVDEFTGRVLRDRRWSGGIHQAVEAKEGVEIKAESKTLASITYQNFFRQYGKLCGLTGTAMTQAGEFMQIYGLEAVAIPTNRPMIRKDHPDVIYKTKEEKFEAIAREIREIAAGGRPVLAGTGSVEDSERLAEELEKLGVRHEVLNAKNHAREAKIIAMAGVPGRVTVATNMAGRGTDILLGGTPQGWEEELGDPDAAKAAWEEAKRAAREAGGLYVFGSTRHESRRVDNQLRGRSGRQGDPGDSRFILSLKDDLFEHAQKGMLAMIDQLNLMPRGTSLEHPFLNRALDRAQGAMENHHFNMRKRLLDYDNVAADQRKAVYAWRNEILDSENAKELAEQMIEEACVAICEGHAPEDSMREQWDLPGLRAALEAELALEEESWDWLADAESAREIRERALRMTKEAWRQRREALGESADALEKGEVLAILDESWQAHLTQLQGLMEGIHLRAYAQKDPLQEYKKDAFRLFGEMREEMALLAGAALMRMRPFASVAIDLGEAEWGSAIEEPSDPPIEPQRDL